MCLMFQSFILSANNFDVNWGPWSDTKVVGEPDSEQNQLNNAAHVVLAVVSLPK